MPIRKMPIGIQDFEYIRENSFVYVDKTSFIYTLAQEGKPYFLGRPRRFGKSLLISALKHYFSGRKDLFIGLAIEKLDKNEVWTQYPVFHIDLNAGNYKDIDGLRATLEAVLSRLEKEWGKDQSERSYETRFSGLIRRASEKTGQKAVVLVDEYDKPLLQSLEKDGLNEEIRAELKAFYGVLKSADPYLRFVFLTGVTKFSKVSIFSDLNQLRDISMLDQYAGICGITETEFAENFQDELHFFAEKNNIAYEKTLALMKQNYNGYHFSEKSEGVFNPFSLLNTFANQKISFYWFETGTPAFLIKELKKSNYYPIDFSKPISITANALEDYRLDGNIIPLFYQSGYLTIVDHNRKNRKTGLYKLGFPNEEVRYGFLEQLLPAYVPLLKENEWFAVTRFLDALESDDINGFMNILQSFLASIPYDLNYNKDEKYYQTVFYLIFTLLGQWIETEFRTATGRIDAVVKTGKTIYIFEFKLSGNGSAEDAFSQIEAKNYALKFAADNFNIVKIGVVFDAEQRNVKEWKIAV